ncbi:unnamed protein product [Ceratitis capitata]|uniref:(Mediterranean fruit fly) hypothetical protein n=1 Tax=Ceratitis capitata TaxID=7213 RepID=A0A811V3X0_CERCA|nr:unnamed protein product [Ceratitis capitata]
METDNSAQGIGVGKSAIRNVKVVKEEKSSIHVHKSSSYLWFERGSRYHAHRHNQRSQSLNRGQALSQADVSGMW